MYGDPTTNAKYWVSQHSMNCTLMATAMVIGQLTGKTPSEAQIVYEASTTPSVNRGPGKSMYLGLNSDTGINDGDARALLANHGITTTYTRYTDPNQALEDLKSTLDDPKKAVIVGIDSAVVWAEVYKKDPPPNVKTADHSVVVIGVDTNNNIVHLNDSGLGDDLDPITNQPVGRDVQIPLDVFIRAWSADSYLIFAGEQTGNPIPRTAWVANMPRKDALDSVVNTPFAMGDLNNNDPAKAQHLVHFR
ncbi:Uncharacterised protein [Mycolicibacterium aichiense]|nr:Uncharacterised protein [Mycolicibacterium aichiense]